MITRLRSPEAAARWLREWTTGTLRTDSREVRPGDAFIAWPGYTADGRRFVDAALKAGASTCLVEAAGVEAFAFEDARIGALPGLKAATGPIADAFFGHPTERLRVVASTGTNGKTSTTWWVAQALTLLGRRCGVVGTLGIGEPPLGAADATFMPIVSTGRTTPDPAVLHAGFHRMQQAGFAACAIEATSIGIVEQRLAGVRMEVALFTNFTRDHLDYHGSMEGYWAAKQKLFAWPGLKAAVINLDDAQGETLAPTLADRLDVWSYSLERDDARLRARGLGYIDGGLAFTLYEGAESLPVRSTLIGDYNAANLLAVIGGLRALGVSLADAVSVVPRLTPVPGRMQKVNHGVGQPQVIVDYAHTPDALEKALMALRPLAQARGGRLVCIFGCGGDRDSSKRPLMGALAERLADGLVLTSDNPRHEAPAAILAGIVSGLAQPQQARVIEDRRAAIEQAVQHAAAADVLLLAGKGHEDYQEVAGEQRPFSDVEESLHALTLLPLLNREANASRPNAGEGRFEGQPTSAGTTAPHGGTGPHPSPPPAGEGATMMTLGLAQQLLPGAELQGDPQTSIARVHSDTRTLRAGDLFVALRGERFDANDFLPQARAAGAVAALAERGLAEADLPGLQVADTRASLATLGAAWRARFDLPLIAVAGSNGKTTVTQMTASILRAWLGDAAFATEGNFNNDIGVPLTLLRLRPGHRAGVVELGMNHPGEIAQLAQLAAPTVALVNNAQREHQEFMASVEAVARENGAAIEALPADGTAVFPADDAYAALWRELAGARRVLTFSLEGDSPARADVWAQARWAADHWVATLRTPVGIARVLLRMPGRHNVMNALAAAACALAAGCPLDAITRGLGAFEPAQGRSQTKPLQLRGRTVTLIDDSYNANPDSVRAAIDVLASLPGPRWLVLGDMGEVGDQGPAFHAEIGSHALANGIDALWTVGTASLVAAHAFGSQARHFDAVAALIAALGLQNAGAPAAQAIVVKGSRFMKMEQVVAALQAGGAAC